MRDENAEYVRMARWRNAPHVREWWAPDEAPMSIDEAVQLYRPRTRADSRATACVIELEGRAIGYLQFYRWCSYPEDLAAMGIELEEGAWGLDTFVGEPELVGQGLGTTCVELACRYLFERRGATAIALVASKANKRALKTYEKAGFTRSGVVLDTDTRDGQRVESWLMVRRRQHSSDRSVRETLASG